MDEDKEKFYALFKRALEQDNHYILVVTMNDIHEFCNGFDTYKVTSFLDYIHAKKMQILTSNIPVETNMEDCRDKKETIYQ